MQKVTKIQDLPPDNGSRLAIYDAIYEHYRTTDTPDISDNELFEKVIGRLHVLVPRELYIAGDKAYFDEKVAVCLEAGIISARSDSGQRFLALTDQPPLVRYPDGRVRDYPAGLEPARERLDRDNARLRESAFNVRKFVPTAADDPRGTSFQELLSSMREHGFMKQFPVVKYGDGIVVDGLARQRAAELLQLDVVYMRYSPQERKAMQRRDTPLNRVLVAIHSNIDRISSDAVDAVYARVADVTRRSWDETAADLALTQEWRNARAPEYTPIFDVQKLPYRTEDEPKIQVTADHKVMVRSLVEAGGLAHYKIRSQGLVDHVPFEKARTAYSGQKADFASAEDLTAGIEAMQQERQAANLKVDPEWEQIHSWLIRNFRAARS